MKVEYMDIKDMIFGDGTKLKEGLLTIDKQELEELLLKDARILSVDVDIAKPGEEVRIIPVKDVIEPRVKTAGGGSLFPGMLSKADTAGKGVTRVLSGAAVVTTGKIVGFQEGMIDMSGSGSDYTPFSSTINLVLVLKPAEGISAKEHEEAIRLAGLRAAVYIGESARDEDPQRIIEVHDETIKTLMGENENLPKVVYIYMLQSQGLLHDTYVYGTDAKRILPTLITPAEIADGAIVSGNCVSACDKNTTYHHQNNPLIEELLEQHGKNLNFIGVIITNENVTLADKERSSNFTAKLAAQLGADGAIISEEGFGNPDTDLIMNCVKLEKQGIKTVLITDEFAGRDGASQSLADADEKADAVVSTGNANEIVHLPPMKKIIGIEDAADKMAGSFEESLKEDGSIAIEIQAIIGATNELGYNRLAATKKK